MSARLIDPSACRWDGIPERSHAQQWVAPANGGPGWHKYERPTDAQVLARMLARRKARADRNRGLRIDALDVSVEVLTAALSQHPDEELAYREAAFLVTHPDAPVSTIADYPGWVPPHTDPDFTRSISDGFVTPVTWDDAYCEPAFAPKPVANVQTGSVL